MGIFSIYQTVISVSIGFAIMVVLGGENFTSTLQSFQQASETINNALR